MRAVYRNEEIPSLLSELRPFVSNGKLPDGTRRWSAYSSPVLGLGHLPEEYHDEVGRAIYVVYSYTTPIGWVLEREADEQGVPRPLVYRVPDVGYSPTTGQHQYALLDSWSRELKRQGTYRRWPSSGRETVRVPGNAEVYGRSIRARSGGMDGVRPGEVVGRETGHVPVTLEEFDVAPRQSGMSAYLGMGDDASHWSPTAQHPADGYEPWERPGEGGWHTPAHP